MSDTQDGSRVLAGQNEMGRNDAAGKVAAGFHLSICTLSEWRTIIDILITSSNNSQRMAEISSCIDWGDCLEVRIRYLWR